MNISEDELKEIKFDSFLNKTIIFSSKNYYKKDVIRNKTELKIVDDENYSEYLKKYIKYEDKNFDFKDIDEFLKYCDNKLLARSLKKLSKIEITVIFGVFVTDLTNNALSKILNIHHLSVSRIKSRALKKITKYMEGCK